MELLNYIRSSNSIEEEVKELSSLAIINYVTDVLEMKVKKVSPLEHIFGDSFEIIAEKDKKKFVFNSEFYDFDMYKPYNSVLILKSISSIEGKYETNHSLYLSRNNLKDEILNTPISELIKFNGVDRELLFVVDLLKKYLGSFKDYSYEETDENNMVSFIVKVGYVSIRKSFSNSIQIDFTDESKKMDSIQLVFRERAESEIEEEISSVVCLIHSYCEWDIMFKSNSITYLYDKLKEIDSASLVNKHRKVRLMPVRISTNSLMYKNELGTRCLFNSIYLGEYDSYNQIKVDILYDYNLNEFILKSEYLMKTFQMNFIGIEEVLKSIELIHEELKSVE